MDTGTSGTSRGSVVEGRDPGDGRSSSRNAPLQTLHSRQTLFLEREWSRHLWTRLRPGGHRDRDVGASFVDSRTLVPGVDQEDNSKGTGNDRVLVGSRLGTPSESRG